VRKLRFAFLLPVIQLLVAVLLRQWGRRILGPRGLDTIYVSTPRLLRFGLNAPAILFKIPALVPTYSPTSNPWALQYRILEFSIFGFSAAELSFLVGVIVLWFLVGRTIDRYRSPGAHQQSSKTGISVLVKIFMIILGACFFVAAVQSFNDFGRYNNPRGNLVQATLFLVWSLVLIILPGFNLVNLFRKAN
jgi:hypothetical protein